MSAEIEKAVSLYIHNLRLWREKDFARHGWEGGWRDGQAYYFPTHRRMSDRRARAIRTEMLKLAAEMQP